MNLWSGIDEHGIERIGALVIKRNPDKYFIEVTSYKGMARIKTLFEVSRWTLKNL